MTNPRPSKRKNTQRQIQVFSVSNQTSTLLSIPVFLLQSALAIRKVIPHMHGNERHKDNRTPPFPVTFLPSQAPAPIPITTKEKPIEQIKPVPIVPIMVPVEPHPEP